MWLCVECQSAFPDDAPACLYCGRRREDGEPFDENGKPVVGPPQPEEQADPEPGRKTGRGRKA